MSKNYLTKERVLRVIVLAASLILLMVVAIWKHYQDEAGALAFSAESGFYPNAFYLEITASDKYDVYYTLDSSTPTADSQRYTGPIYIDNASLNKNTYSMTEGMTAGEWGQAPDFLIDKCTVIRAVAIPKDSSDSQQSKVITKSYFVGFPDGYFNDCGIISLVTDPANLFDSTDGIYVAGDALEEYLASTETPAKLWQYWSANYLNRGRAWEREANITFWDSNGSLLLNKDIGIRIQGGITRAMVPRSLNLYAREEYDGSSYFEYDFFDTSSKLKKMTLSAGGNAYITRMNDYLMSERVHDLSYGVMTYKPYVMFLDGEYWGFYWLTEKYDETYIRSAYDVKTSDVVIIKSEKLEEGNVEDFALYEQMIEFVANNDMVDNHNYARACGMIDINSCIDYFATMIYIARNHDWPNYNEAMWRVEKVSNAQYADGKWRWLLFDCNGHCMSQADHNTLEYVLERSPLFRSLWNSPSFREAFEIRIMQIADQCFDAEEMYQFIEAYKCEQRNTLTKTWARFFGSNNNMENAFIENTTAIEAFFCQRREVVAAWFE